MTVFAGNLLISFAGNEESQSPKLLNSKSHLVDFPLDMHSKGLVWRVGALATWECATLLPAAAQLQPYRQVNLVRDSYPRCDVMRLSGGGVLRL